MSMTPAEWARIVDRLNDSYPSQPISADTAREWYEELADLDEGEVWLAIRAHRRHEPFRPGVAAILAGAAIHRQDMAEALAAQQRAAAAPRRAPRSGVPMPPETREALRILAERMNPATPADERAEAHRMIEALADQLAARITPAEETVRDATRTCGACATSPQAGFVEHVLPPGHRDNPYPHPSETLIPCPYCRPGRHDAWKRGRTADKTSRDGYVAGLTRTTSPAA